MKKIEIMTRIPCTSCNGTLGYVWEGSHGRESWVDCRCVNKHNPAGRGMEVKWLEQWVEE